MKEVRTVGDLRELLRYSEDEEPLTLKMANEKYLICDGASSSAGGRATILWFKYQEKND